MGSLQKTLVKHEAPCFHCICPAGGPGVWWQTQEQEQEQEWEAEEQEEQWWRWKWWGEVWCPILHRTGYRVSNILLKLLQDRVQHFILQCVYQHTPDIILQPVLPATDPGASLHLHQRGAGGGLHSGW